MRLRRTSEHEMTPLKRAFFLLALLVGDTVLTAVEALARRRRAHGERGR